MPLHVIQVEEHTTRAFELIAARRQASENVLVHRACKAAAGRLITRVSVILLAIFFRSFSRPFSRPFSRLFLLISSAHFLP